MRWARVSTGISLLLASSPAAIATITGPGRLSAPNGERSAAVTSVCSDPRVQVRLVRMPHSPAETVRAAELTRSPITPASLGSAGSTSGPARRARQLSQSFLPSMRSGLTNLALKYTFEQCGGGRHRPPTRTARQAISRQDILLLQYTTDLHWRTSTRIGASPMTSTESSPGRARYRAGTRPGRTRPQRPQPDAAADRSP